jgi:hypothetical protein
MKSSKGVVRATASNSACDFELRQELMAFSEAICSYPACFARDPGLSFEEHLFSIIASYRDSRPPRRR